MVLGNPKGKDTPDHLLEQQLFKAGLFGCAPCNVCCEPLQELFPHLFNVVVLVLLDASDSANWSGDETHRYQMNEMNECRFRSIQTARHHDAAGKSHESVTLYRQSQEF